MLIILVSIEEQGKVFKLKQFRFLFETHTLSVKFLHDKRNEAIHATIALILPDFSFEFCKLLWSELQFKTPKNLKILENLHLQVQSRDTHVLIFCAVQFGCSNKHVCLLG